MSDEVVIAQKGPYKVGIKAGEKYFWCRCGRSATQPFCDGAHKAVGMKPCIYTAEEDKTVWFCGCKHSGSEPFCDGTHNRL
ncbi:MAG: CDGSH iron-sulfur domain-containing protein [Rhodospirillales bacterium]|nr:CDGSH iron-sulfur domain-containing protein [Rhodospirillales bacterium]